jgi:hypothetical protein
MRGSLGIDGGPRLRGLSRKFYLLSFAGQWLMG